MSTPVSLPEIVSDGLVTMIAEGEIPPGGDLPSEGSLAARFNVSKPTVREALSHLSALGILEVRKGRVARLRPLDSSALDTFFRIAVRTDDNGLMNAQELRRTVEVGSAQMAARHADAGALEAIRDSYRAMAAGIHDIDAWLAADFRFHMAVTAASGNRLMALTVNGLAGVMRYNMRVVGVQLDLRDARLSLARHEAILAAIENHDPQAAGDAMTAHFEATEPVLRAILRDNSRLARI